MSAHEIMGLEGGLVSSVYVEIDASGARITVRSRGKTAGTLVIEPRDMPLMMARLLGDVAVEDPPALGVLARMVSLVQSIAEPRDTSDASVLVESWQDEAREIVDLAGWE